MIDGADGLPEHTVDSLLEGLSASLGDLEVFREAQRHHGQELRRWRAPSPEFVDPCVHVSGEAPQVLLAGIGREPISHAADLHRHRSLVVRHGPTLPRSARSWVVPWVHVNERHDRNFGIVRTPQGPVMIKVACPSCSAPYDLDERRLPASGLKMRCPKCGSSFQVHKDGSVGEASAAEPPKKRPKKTMVGLGGATPPVAPPTKKKPIAPAFPAGLTGGGGSAGKATGGGKLPAGIMGGAPKPPAPSAPKSPFAPPPPAGARPAPPKPPAPPRPAAPAAPKPPPPVRPPAPKPSAPVAAPKPPPPKPAAPVAGLDIDDGLDLPTPAGRTPSAAQKTAAAKRPAPAPTAAAKRPAPPPSDDGLDLPAPKRPRPASGGSDDGLDLPAPAKRKIAPAFDDLDLPPSPAAGAQRQAPTPPAQSAGSKDDGLDLPVPAAKRRKLAPDFDDGLDLPVASDPARRARQQAPTVGELDLDDGLDLPAPRSKAPDAGGLDLDLPMPAARGKKSDLELDFPVPKSSSGTSDLELDLPVAKSRGGDFDLDLDLPAPKGGGVDLPAPLDSADLPAPLSGGIDLPAPKDGADLPAPRTPFDDFDSDLPAPAADLPRPAGGGFGDLDLDLPSPVADLPAPAADLPAPAADLPSLAADLPSPAADLPSPAAGLPGPAADLPGIDLDMGMDLDDDLALPDPRPIEDVTSDGRSGAGGASFGELDLGGQDSGSLEFDEIPEEEEDDDDGNLDLPSGPTAFEKPKDAKAKRERPKPTEKKKKRTGLWVMLTLMVLIGAGGAALHFTPYGLFGMYFVEQYRSEAGDPGQIQLVLDDADAAAALDTHSGYRDSLRTLASARTDYFYNRRLLARSVVYESLYQVRFGADLRAESRAGRILDRLEIRGNDAPGMELALAAHALSQGRLGEVQSHLSRARSEDPNDLLLSIVAGEHALQLGNADAALAAFQEIDLETDARSSWGVARAQRELGNTAEYEAAVTTTLERSPGHAAALVAKAELALDAGDVDAAQAAAETVVGRVPVDGERMRASDAERAKAWTLLGRLHEAAGRRGSAQDAYERAVDAEPFELFALLGLGRLSLDEGRFQDAATQFDAAEQSLRERPLPPAEQARSPELDIRMGKVRALIALEQVQQAVSAAAAMVQAFPESPEAALWQGKAFEAAEDAEQALLAYQRAVELAPESFDGYLAQAQLHFTADDADAAAAILTEAREKVPPSVEMHRSMGESELRRGNLAAARAELQAALDLRGDDPRTLFLIGRTLRRANELDDAERHLDRLSRMDPGYPGLALERGQLFEARGNPTAAVESYAKALEERPDDLDLLLRMGGAKVSAGQLDEAEEVLGRVMAERRNSPEGEFFLGRIELERGDTQQAITRLGRAVELDSSSGEFRMWLASAYLRANNLARAIEEVRQAIELDQNLARAYLVRGQVHLRSGAVSEAKDDFERTLQLRPSLIEARAGLADAYQQLGRRGDAIAAFEQAVAAENDHGAWWYQLGRLRLDSGRGREANAAFERAAALEADLPPPGPGGYHPEWAYESHRYLGDAARQGRREEALTHYRRYLELAPDTALDRSEVERRVESMTQ